MGNWISSSIPDCTADLVSQDAEFNSDESIVCDEDDTTHGGTGNELHSTIHNRTTFAYETSCFLTDQCVHPMVCAPPSNITVAPSAREPRDRGYMEGRECDEENIQAFLRAQCPCCTGTIKSCINRFRGKVDDPFTSILKLRQERFAMKQNDEKKW